MMIKEYVVLTGVIKHWNDEKGYGFIKRDDGDRDAFLHIAQLQLSGLVPQEGLRVRFELTPGRNGKMQATNVGSDRDNVPDWLYGDAS